MMFGRTTPRNKPIKSLVRRNDIRAALAAGAKINDPRVQAVIGAYGAEGAANGVAVAMGKLPGSTAAQVGPGSPPMIAAADGLAPLKWFLRLPNVVQRYCRKVLYSPAAASAFASNEAEMKNRALLRSASISGLMTAS
jgi:hypothetical protein